MVIITATIVMIIKINEDNDSVEHCIAHIIAVRAIMLIKHK